MGLSSDRPLRAPLDDKPILMSLHPDVGWKIEFRSRAGFVAEPQIVIEEIQPYDEPHSRARVGSVDVRVSAHVVVRGLEYHRRLIDLRAASPQSDGSGVTGRGRHALAVGARKQQRIGIEPLSAALRFRQNEAIGDTT